MKALPTTYKNTTFRSRLEADWAFNLDDRGIEWIYEPEGYQLSDGTCYSPDFYLPSARAWLEVKGAHGERISKVERFAAELWAESGVNDTYNRQAPLVLLGQDPLSLWGHSTLNLQGVMGPGKKYSVGILRCWQCNRGTVVALWQPSARCCGAPLDVETLGEELLRKHCRWPVYDNFEREFRRLPRPAGRQS